MICDHWRRSHAQVRRALARPSGGLGRLHDDSKQGEAVSLRPPTDLAARSRTLLRRPNHQSPRADRKKRSQCREPSPQLGIVQSARAIQYRHPHTAYDPARPPLAHIERRTQVSDPLSLGSGHHHFFARRSALSSMVWPSPQGQTPIRSGSIQGGNVIGPIARRRLLRNSVNATAVSAINSIAAPSRTSFSKTEGW